MNTYSGTTDQSLAAGIIQKKLQRLVNPEVTVWSLKYLQQLHSQKKGSLPDTLAIGYISHRYQIVINV